ncbi:hypothetical protein ACIPPQ_20415 [Sphingopyxis sp. LARHCG72]
MAETEAPYQTLDRLENELYALVPPLDPAPCHWLDSDATFSYCWACARQARWEEMGNVGPAPFEIAFYYRDPIEENIRGGIDGGFDASASDSPESCEGCRRTLRHTLTEYGVETELDHFREHPGFQVVRDEDSYVISRICLNLTWSGAPDDQVGEAIKIVEDALATAKAQAVEQRNIDA